MTSDSWSPERTWPRLGWSVLAWLLAVVAGGSLFCGSIALMTVVMPPRTGFERGIGDAIGVLFWMLFSAVLLLIGAGYAAVTVHRLSSDAPAGRVGVKAALATFFSMACPSLFFASTMHSRSGFVAASAIVILSWLLCGASTWSICLGVRALRIRVERRAERGQRGEGGPG